MTAARDPSEVTMGAAMASLDLSALPTSPESESEHEHCIDIVSVDGYTFDQIVEYIVDAHRCGTESIISLRCPADFAWDLSARLNEKLIELDELEIRRFEYDYQSGIAYIDIMVETSLHSQFLVGAHCYIEISFARFTATIQDATIRRRITQDIRNFSTSHIAKKDEILKQGDFAFGPAMNKLPCLVGEVS
ncbi:hypothetical protein MFIFM68171_02277 [Madurella fahalii]|uniref:Uncharacterized protein n=1 Tax=Madurella fahalii TaxID=1157608 RepID=A0ABQ0G2S5_9PEZI